MLSEDQTNEVRALIQAFREKVANYMQKKSEIKEYDDRIEAKIKELSKVAEEERQMDIAVEVLYGQTKGESEAGKIVEDLERWRSESDNLKNELTQVKTELLIGMRKLPIPVDLGRTEEEGSGIAFPYIKDAELGNEAIDAISDLFRQEQPLTFNDVAILPEKVLVNNSKGGQEAIRKLVEAIQSFRLRVDNISKSYEKIDGMIDRLLKSKLYTAILRTLFEKGKLSSDDIASMLSVDGNKVYQACYNLTRSNWSPSPIERKPSGEWELTLAGEILINRVLEKYPDKKERASQTEGLETVSSVSKSL